MHIYIGCATRGVTSTLHGDVKRPALSPAFIHIHIISSHLAFSIHIIRRIASRLGNYLISCLTTDSRLRVSQVVRTILVTETGQKLVFDWSIANERTNGDVNNEWVHMILSVDRRSVQVFVDGQPVTEYGFPLGGGSNAWVTTAANVAYPDGPTDLDESLSEFAMGSSYESNREYWLPIQMAAGAHTFHGFVQDVLKGRGWGGGYIEIFGADGGLVFGGEQDGRISGEDGAGYSDVDFGNHLEFTLDAAQLVTLHLTTKRWAKYISWSIDGGGEGFAGPPAGQPIRIGSTGSW